jgi:hypothetical protein
MIRLRLRWPVRAAVVVLVVGTALGLGCSGDDEPDASGAGALTTPADDPADASTGDDPDGDAGDADLVYVAEALDTRLVVRGAAQSAARELVTLRADEQVSGKITCLVVQQVGDWVEIELPVEFERRGWVHRDDVAISRHDFRIEVSRGEHELTLTMGDETALTEPVALGPDAPAEGSDLFVTELIEPPDDAPVYRRYAYGLSGSTNDLAGFRADEGVVAVHGVADAERLGGDVDKGSIGVGTDVVATMVDAFGLPLGTPVTVVE